MTRKEAIERLEWLKETCHGLATRTPSWQRWALQEAALNMALTALRFPTREMVERVRGERIGDNEEKVETIDGSPTKSATCSNCGNWLVGSDEYSCAGYFCPACGAPMTDEAVDMMLERWKEVLGDEN